MKIQRRTILKGLGGFTLALPFLEELREELHESAGMAVLEGASVRYSLADRRVVEALDELRAVLFGTLTEQARLAAAGASSPTPTASAADPKGKTHRR